MHYQIFYTSLEKTNLTLNRFWLGSISILMTPDKVLTYVNKYDTMKLNERTISDVNLSSITNLGLYTYQNQ
jgi:hypothetical protein